MTRVVLFTGKGGVGKTTCATATAATAANRGTCVPAASPAAAGGSA